MDQGLNSNSNKESDSNMTETLDMDDSIFGGMDVDSIPDDPFAVDDGLYKATLIEAKMVKQDDRPNLSLNWQIDDPGGRFHNSRVSEWYPVFTEEEQKSDANKMKKMSFMKLRLRRGLDVPADEMKTVKPGDLIGREAYIQTKVNEGTGENIGKKFTNVVKATSVRLAEEEGLNVHNGQDENSESLLGM